MLKPSGVATRLLFGCKKAVFVIVIRAVGKVGFVGSVFVVAVVKQSFYPVC